MLGVVFARFSAPFKRASTVRFSTVAVISRHPSGYWALTLRVANLRKHQILQPAVRLVRGPAAAAPAARRAGRFAAWEGGGTRGARVRKARAAQEPIRQSIAPRVGSPEHLWTKGTVRVRRTAELLACVPAQVVTAVDSITPSYYHHEQLQIEGAYKQVRAPCTRFSPGAQHDQEGRRQLRPSYGVREPCYLAAPSCAVLDATHAVAAAVAVARAQLTNLELGFPAHISHVITPDSFLYNLSLLEMDTRMMEVSARRQSGAGDAPGAGRDGDAGRQRPRPTSSGRLAGRGCTAWRGEHMCARVPAARTPEVRQASKLDVGRGPVCRCWCLWTGSTP